MVDPTDRAIARRSVLFGGLPDRLAERIFEGATTRTVSHGETIFSQGDRSTTLFVVLEGWIKLTRLAPNGNEAVIGIFKSGQSFAEAVALQKAPYPVSAQAVTQGRLLAVPARTVLALLHEHPETVAGILAALYHQLHALVLQVEQLKGRAGTQRVAEFLVELCEGQPGRCIVRLPYDKSLVAARLGMKPESLSRAFARLRNHGVKVRQHEAEIADVARLKAYSEQDPAEAWSKS